MQDSLIPSHPIHYGQSGVTVNGLMAHSFQRLKAPGGPESLICSVKNPKCLLGCLVHSRFSINIEYTKDCNALGRQSQARIGVPTKAKLL